jgi:hypothetical protein
LIRSAIQCRSQIERVYEASYLEITLSTKEERSQRNPQTFPLPGVPLCLSICPLPPTLGSKRKTWARRGWAARPQRGGGPGCGGMTASSASDRSTESRKSHRSRTRFLCRPFTGSSLKEDLLPQTDQQDLGKGKRSSFCTAGTRRDPAIRHQMLARCTMNHPWHSLPPSHLPQPDGVRPLHPGYAHSSYLP